MIEYQIELRLHNMEHIGAGYAIKDNCKELVDELFDVLANVEISGYDNLRELVVYADRGSLEEFSNVLTQGIYTKAEIAEWYSQVYPLDRYPHRLKTIEHDFASRGHYRAIFIDDRLVFQQNAPLLREGAYDISDFLEWLINAVKEQIASF